jgi:hypothetical protein
MPSPECDADAADAVIVLVEFAADDFRLADVFAEGRVDGFAIAVFM